MEPHHPSHHPPPPPGGNAYDPNRVPVAQGYQPAPPPGTTEFPIEGYRVDDFYDPERDGEDHVGYDDYYGKTKPRRRWRRWLGGFVLLVLVLGLAQGFFARRVWRSIERVPLAAVLDPSPGLDAGVNILIVGSDSRADISADDPNAGAILGGGLSGERTDTMLVLRVTEQGTVSMAIPRDLYVTIAGSGNQQRINAAIQGGPDRLINTVRDNLGIPIHHYAEIDFSGFVGLVDAIGGVDITFEHPAFDRRSGFDQVPAGTVGLDGPQALAYVRSRFYTEIIDGQEVVDGRSDLGRVERQQDFLRAVLAEITALRNPIRINLAASRLSDHIVLDDAMRFFDAINIGRTLGSDVPQSLTLPTTPFTTSGGAQVLGLVEGEAVGVLDQFR